MFLGFNSFAKEIKSGGVIQRLAVDSLPGYQLEPSDGTVAEVEHYAQMQTSILNSESHSLNIELYIAKHNQIFIGEKHIIKITSKGYKILAEQVNGGVNQLNYKIEIGRVSDKMTFQLVRGVTNTAYVEMSPLSTMSPKFIYINLVVGGSILYFTGPDQARFKFHETLHVFVEGSRS